jgi:hypothetical protein
MAESRESRERIAEDIREREAKDDAREAQDAKDQRGGGNKQGKNPNQYTVKHPDKKIDRGNER